MTLAVFEPTIEHLWWIIGILTLKATIMTTQDIAIDGYMVENLSAQERGVGAAVMDIGRNVAQFTTFAVVVAIYGVYGWDIAALSAAGLLLVFSLPAMLRREPPPPPEAEAARARGRRPSLLTLLRRADTRLVLPMVFQVAFVGGLIPQLYVAFLVDKGFTVAEIGPRILAPATAIGTLIGASLTVTFLNRFGYKRTILMAAVAIVPTVVPIMWMGSLPDPSLAIVFLVTLNGIVLPSFLQVAIAASRLKWASRSQAATDYTVQIVTMSGASSLALAIGGFIAEHTGWLWYFVIAGGAVIAGCFTFYALFERIERMVEARDRAEREHRALEPSDRG